MNEFDKMAAFEHIQDNLKRKTAENEYQMPVGINRLRGSRMDLGPT